MILAAVGGIILSLGIMAREGQTASATASLVRDITAAEFGDAPPIPGAAIRSQAPVRALLSDALWRARAAQRSHDPALRARLLGEAERNLAIVRNARRWWGDAWMLTGFVRSLAGDSAGMRAAMARSYRDAPYLHFGGGWRVRQGLADWDGYDAQVRAHIVDEAVWLARSDADGYRTVSALARLSPGYEAFMLRFLDVRQQDPDFGPLKRVAP